MIVDAVQEEVDELDDVSSIDVLVQREGQRGPEDTLGHGRTDVGVGGIDPGEVEVLTDLYPRAL